MEELNVRIEKTEKTIQRLEFELDMCRSFLNGVQDASKGRFYFLYVIVFALAGLCGFIVAKLI